MSTSTITGTYGGSHTPCDVFTYNNYSDHTWYCVQGSTNVNCTHHELEDGVDVETLEDVDTFQATKEVESEEDLEYQVGL